jgi:hypothetical protein
MADSNQTSPARPIATAPRDGTRIMVFDSEKEIWVFGRWAEGEDIEQPYTHWMPEPPKPLGGSSK